MKGMYGLNSGIGRLVKEAVFVACLAALMLLPFPGVGMVKQGRSLEAQVGEARRQIAERPVMMPGRRLTLGASGEALSLWDSMSSRWISAIFQMPRERTHDDNEKEDFDETQARPVRRYGSFRRHQFNALPRRLGANAG